MEFCRATIIQPNRSTFGYVQQKNVYSPPVIRGTFSGRESYFVWKSKKYILSYLDGANGYATSHIYVKLCEFIFREFISVSIQDSANVFSTIEGARNTLNTIQSYLQFESSQPRPSKSVRILSHIYFVFLKIYLVRIVISSQFIIFLLLNFQQSMHQQHKSSFSHQTYINNEISIIVPLYHRSQQIFKNSVKKLFILPINRIFSIKHIVYVQHFMNF